MVTIQLDNLAVALARRPILHDVTATFAPGALIGIVGPNGAGKSTLVRTLLGLLRPQGGSVRIDGQSLANLARRRIARSIAYLPQGQTLHWPLSVERLVSLGRLPYLAPFSRMTSSDQEAVETAMDRADITHLRTRTGTELSGGERARVMLARALAVGAPALIADEPLASLDPGHQIDVMELLAAEARSGKLVITVLHDLTMATRFCNQLLLLDAGRVVASGPPADVLSAQRLRDVYGITVRTDLSGDWPVIVPERRFLR